jgi:hypothetical protein
VTDVRQGGVRNNETLYIVKKIYRRPTGRAIEQEVSRRLPTSVAWVRAQVTSCGICGGQSGTRAGFLRVLRFPLPILIPPTSPHSLSAIIRIWYNRQISDRRTKWTQSHLTPRKKKELTVVQES